MCDAQEQAARDMSVSETCANSGHASSATIFRTTPLQLPTAHHVSHVEPVAVCTLKMRRMSVHFTVSLIMNLGKTAHVRSFAKNSCHSGRRRWVRHHDARAIETQNHSPKRNTFECHALRQTSDEVHMWLARKLHRITKLTVHRMDLAAPRSAAREPS